MPDNKQLSAFPSSLRKPRVVRSKAQWQSLLAEYESSSLTQQAFCKQHDLPISSFHKWRHRLSQESTDSFFVELNAEPTTYAQQTPPTSGDWQVELELAGDIVLRIRTA